MCIKCKLFGWLPDFIQPKCINTKQKPKNNDLIFNYNQTQTQNPHAPKLKPDEWQGW